ncbi:hypothetical protein F4561_003576 [Lipingzhangella halophila]|uniref:Uncharacterized protein n=1 Tax=Lipingzhangella halophila TaxID=1783352 RepID=A0A7W7RJQ7_9ACTN|nr:hypothetical protein [Lipingzhangella halophila]
MRFNRDKLPVGDPILVVYYPDDDSDAAEKLRMLASLSNAAPSDQAQLSAPPPSTLSGPAAPSRQAES